MYTANELRRLPTLSQGQTCNLKIDTGTRRVWLCRCGIADGMAYNNQVTEERLRAGRWEVAAEYEG